MDKRAAKRQAHQWVSHFIEGALGNGSGDDFGVNNDADRQRVLDAIREIQAEHDRRAEH